MRGSTDDDPQTKQGHRESEALGQRRRLQMNTSTRVELDKIRGVGAQW
ncbi:MAG: hypothetical protein AVDCRST_MAG40-3451 [uncultured Gemmatimonadaceae bacterium]|uniref:Uncharacterized protein n=1 Tax=uncultured Gemmatimonadaceae bacterium TaxID=246130 RepID=A0A6J4MP40_9BACT|nr:MAG: hypothetical protein AVDCRST_MAG40-3451 [uncultured Gemmatimonadaceae bacterium]